MNKILSIGIDDFKELINGNNYYIDKSNLIGKLIDENNKATLITRPRRFGKSLNMSMIKYFFEKPIEDNRYLFNDLEVSKNDKYMQEQGKYPVISLSFSFLKNDNFKDNISSFSEYMADVFEYEEKYMDFDKLTPREKNKWNKFINCESTQTDLITSIQFLSKCLEKSTNEKVIILIDEYDVPLDNAYFNGFYN